ncbi:MAG: PQQ-binding-like beta-propeller repeat protein [Planctomycetota bacterium]|nr:PQQ-binding-like beta-propeller repeat protein [Planctomycetota bacterium]
MRTSIWRIALVLCALRAAGLGAGEANFKSVTLQDLLGPRWPEFERSFAALARDPRNDQAFRMLSVVLGETKTEMKIAPYLSTLLERDPSRTGIRVILGRVYKDLLQDPGAAAEHFKKVLADEPKNFFAHYQLASLYALRGGRGFEPAVEHFRLAAACIESAREYVDLRTRIYRELGDLFYENRHANPEFEARACEAWDGMTGGVRRFDLPTYEELARIYQSRERWAKVTETYERYVAELRKEGHKPDSLALCGIKIRVGEAHERDGKLPEAIAAYETALEYLDDNAWQRRKLEKQVEACQRRLGQEEAYRAKLARRVEQEPGNLAAKLSLLRMLENSGRLEEAVALLAQARENAPRNVPLLNAAERVFRAARKHDELAAVLEAKLELSPENFRAYVELAELCLQQPEKAREVLGRLENSPSRLPEKFWLLGETYRRFKMPEQAFALYARALEPGGLASRRLAFCEFCLQHEAFKGEAGRQAKLLCAEGLDAAGYVHLSSIFSNRGELQTALWILGQGLQARKDAPAAEKFLLNEAQARLAQQLGEGHRWLAIQSTLAALLDAPTLYFKKKLNDRFVTLLSAYGHHHKLLYGPEDAKRDPARLFGGVAGLGIAPWVEFLSEQANAREDVDLWILLGQVHETVSLEAEIPGANGREARRIRADIGEALKCYQKAVDLEFQNLEAHQGLARVLADPAIDEYEKAVTEYETLGVLNPVEKFGYRKEMGDLYAAAGEKEKAGALWEELARELPNEPNLLLQVGMRLFEAALAQPALDLAGQAARLSSHGFPFQFARANLMADAAEADPSVTKRDEAAQALRRALELAEASPPWKGWVEPLRAALERACTLLARAEFGASKFEDALKHLQVALAYARASEDAAAKRRAAELSVQVLRCEEALGKLAEPLARYEDALKGQPDWECWISPRLSVPAARFLELKRSGSLREGEAGKPAPRAASGVKLAGLRRVSLHERILAMGLADGAAHVKTAQGLRAIESKSGAVRKLEREEAPGDEGIVQFCGAGAQGMFLLQQGRLWRFDAAPARWRSLPAAEAAQPGAPRIDRLWGCAQALILGGPDGLQAFDPRDGKTLWRAARADPRCALDDGVLAVLSRTTEGPETLELLDPRTGELMGRAALTASPGWHAPLLAAGSVLLVDSFNGQLLGFDRRDGRPRFSFASGVAPVWPPMACGEVALLHYLHAGGLRVVGVDLKSLRVRFDAALQPAGGAPLGALRALASEPLVWRDKVLYGDAVGKRLLVLDVASGAVREAALPEGAPERFERWALDGDRLIFLLQGGELVLAGLECTE